MWCFNLASDAMLGKFVRDEDTPLSDERNGMVLWFDYKRESELILIVDLF